jgi:hypothetical protein
VSTRKIPGSKAGRCLRLTIYHLLVPNVKKIRGLTYRMPMGLFCPVAGQLYFYEEISNLLVTDFEISYVIFFGASGSVVVKALRC